MCRLIGAIGASFVIITGLDLAAMGPELAGVISTSAGAKERAKLYALIQRRASRWVK